MRIRSLAFAALACVASTFAVVSANAAEAPATPSYVVLKHNASIPFALRTINGYHVGVDRSLILDVGHRWYRAELDSFCARDLRWTTAIAVRPGGIGAFDRFSHVLVDGRRCRVLSLDEIADPRPVDRAARVAREAAEHAREHAPAHAEHRP
ncbi:MAG: hypothetical protein JNJ73_13930 [Hyphomonadaceae bacterium]|nr:hypothetical protein [Hyphomonadaceae bacterium]